MYETDFSNNNVQKFDSSGNFITKWGPTGFEDGQLDGPYSIAIDSSGNVYVAEGYNSRIQVFAPSSSTE